VIGDRILQPGPHDIGNGEDDDSWCPLARAYAGFGNLWARLFRRKSRLKAIVPRQEDYDIAVLSKFIPIDFTGGMNRIDCALAIPLDISFVREDILEVGTLDGIQSVSVGATVFKSGRTTGITQGIVQGIDGQVQVNYGNNRMVMFDGQIITDNMLSGGDSGSVLVDETKTKAVGLSFAGSNKIGIHNPIEEVFEALEIKCIGQ